MSFCQLWDAFIPLWRRRRSKGRIHSAEFVFAHFLVAVLVLSVKHKVTRHFSIERTSKSDQSVKEERTKTADFTGSNDLKDLIK